jgi:hypothetical protein
MKPKAGSILKKFCRVGDRAEAFEHRLDGADVGALVMEACDEIIVQESYLYRDRGY